MMRPLPALWMVIATVVAMIAGVSAAEPTPREAAAAPQSVQGDVARGHTLYETRCAVCHGPEGKGDGQAKFVLFPKPRDFTTGVFKIRSTMTLPTDNDLFQTITHGISGTSMPSWSTLTEQERWDLVAFIKNFSLRFTLSEFAGQPVEIPKPPPQTRKLLAIGKHFYTEAGCFECHGKTGRGDGPAAATLKDEWNAPIVAYDFTVPGRMKGGSTLRDIYRTLTAGIGGTPMPSYADSLSEQERWALGYYTLSLARKQPPERAVQEVTTISSRFVTATLPTDPSAILWQQAKPVAIRTRTLWLRPQEVGQIRVASYHNGREIGILLEWDDPVGNHETLRHEEFRDAAAIQFPIAADELTYAMGAHGAPVNIWHWKADWEVDLTHYHDAQDRYPNMTWDLYPMLRSGGPHDLVRAATASHDPTYLAGWGAGNPFSTPSRVTPIENLNATGLGTLTSQPPEYQTVKGHGRWTDGKWRVIMVRLLQTDNERDAQLTPGASVPIAFSIWDGAQGDRDGRKAVTVWQQLVLEPTR